LFFAQGPTCTGFWKCIFLHIRSIPRLWM
jgi:hypothetical protein